MSERKCLVCSHCTRWLKLKIDFGCQTTSLGTNMVAISLRRDNEMAAVTLYVKHT